MTASPGNERAYRASSGSGKTLPFEGHGLKPIVLDCMYGLNRLRKNALYEGHGFSRAVNVLRGDGFSR
jgi:hypothetical protein